MIFRNDHQNGSEYDATDNTDQSAFIANVKLLDEDDTSSTEGYNIEQPFNGNWDGYTGVISKDNEWHHIVLSFDKINDNVNYLLMELSILALGILNQ